MALEKTLLFMLRNPLPFIVHFTCWALLAASVVVQDDPFVEGTWPYVVKILERPLSVGNLARAASIVFGEIIEDVTRHGHWILVVMPPFLISYREARGNLKGIAKEHQLWMRWYRRQQEAEVQGDTFEAPPSSENIRVNSYFRKAQKTLFFMVRNPKLLLIHFLCWFFSYFLLILMTLLPDIADIVRTASNFVRNFSSDALYFSSGALFLATIAALLAFISSYQETRGTVKGIAKVQQAWTKWYHRQQEAKGQGMPFDVSPPLFDIAG